MITTNKEIGFQFAFNALKCVVFPDCKNIVEKFRSLNKKTSRMIHNTFSVILRNF